MVNFFIPTDFSPLANNACASALLLAPLYQATLHFYHCSSLIPAEWHLIPQNEQHNFPEISEEINRIESALKTWEERADSQSIRASISYSGGDLLENIITSVEAKSIDMIIMGSHGASGPNDYYLGSNTQKVIRKVQVPVFVLKQEIKRFPFQKIVFASSFESKDAEVFKYFMQWIKPFEPEIHLLAINTSSFFSQPSMVMHAALEDFKKLCTPLRSVTHFYHDTNVEAGIRHFSQKVDADLIVISNHYKHPAKRLFQGSNVEYLINYSDLPVLTLDY
jgi:nucleotide-binding universal stress UspA family protein